MSVTFYTTNHFWHHYRFFGAYATVRVVFGEAGLRTCGCACFSPPGRWPMRNLFATFARKTASRWNVRKAFSGRLSSSTFGLAPLFTLLLLGAGYSSFEVLTYRWGVASLCLGVCGVAAGCDFRLGRKELRAVFLLSLFPRRHVVFARHSLPQYRQRRGFDHPFHVSAGRGAGDDLFFRERGSVRTFAAIGLSIAGAVLLSSGNVDFTQGDTLAGMIAAAVSVFSYAGYIVGVRRSRAARIDSTALTCYVMAFGALFFLVGGSLTGGVRIETDLRAWLCILGLALPATAVSNMALVQAIRRIGPTLTSVFGAMEPLTAVVIGVAVFAEPFTAKGAAGILLIVAAVLLVVLRRDRGGV